VTTNLSSALPSPPPHLDVPTRALTVGAHPDDAEFGAGATLGRWADAGCHIGIVVVTDGSKGSWDTNADLQTLVDRRRDEQHAAAGVLGVSDVMFLGHTDGELEYSSELRSQIAEVIRTFRPNVVLTHDPWQRYQMHPDHRVTGLAAVDGVVSAREPLAKSPSGLAHHRPEALLLWSADEPDHLEPVDDTYFQRKLDALLCHSSQSETTMGDAASSSEQRRTFEHRMREWLEASGGRFGTGMAEIFKRLTP
jgi:LmbE family N-acetylglucosaminyl deacetylase